ncbi:MAG: hypothetical protein ACP5JG_10725 [Anaerolineae bacterium]
MAWTECLALDAEPPWNDEHPAPNRPMRRCAATEGDAFRRRCSIAEAAAQNEMRYGIDDDTRNASPLRLARPTPHPSVPRSDDTPPARATHPDASALRRR